MLQTQRMQSRVALDEHGVTVLRNAVDAPWIGMLREAVDAALARPTPLGQQFARNGGAFYSDMYLSRSFSQFATFLRESPVSALTAETMGVERMRLFTDELLVKEPGTSLETPWHHDGPYWPIAGDKICTAWITLDPVDADSGALEFVKGSHRWARRFHPCDFDTGAVRVTSADEEPLPPIEREVAPRDRLLAEVTPGDVVLFHALTLHRASGNLRLSSRRRAVVLRLVGPDVCWDPRPRTLPLIWAPRLSPGEPLGGELFPTLWPRPA